MKKVILWVISAAIVAIIINNIGWSVAWKHLESKNARIQHERDSVKLVSFRLRNERDSLIRVDSIIQAQNIHLDDTIKLIRNEINNIQNRHRINRNNIRNSNDQQYQEYITNHRLPDFNERYTGKQNRDSIH